MSKLGNILGDEDYDADKKEEDRTSRHVKASQEKAIASKNPRPKTDGWVISIRNLPQDPGQNVSVEVNGQIVYQGNGGGDATADFTAPITGTGTNNKIVLKVPVMGAVVDRTYSAAEGCFVKFEFTGKGLAMNQQSNPF